MGEAPGRLIGRITIGLIAFLALECAVLALDAAFPPDLGRAARSSPVALDRRGAWLRALPVENGRWRIRADLERTDPVFLSRLLRIEDARFFAHPGVDPLAVARAGGSALLRGRISSGAEQHCWWRGRERVRGGLAPGAGRQAVGGGAAALLNRTSARPSTRPACP